MSDKTEFPTPVRELAEAGFEFYRRGWAIGGAAIMTGLSAIAFSLGCGAPVFMKTNLAGPGPPTTFIRRWPGGVGGSIRFWGGFAASAACLIGDCWSGSFFFSPI